MNDQNLIERQVNSEAVFQGNFMRVFRDTVQLPDGAVATREYIKHSGAVAILALDQDNQLILERQYRHPVQQVMLEIPAGKLDPNEDPLSCGRRELVEETGYIAKEWLLLGECLPCIGYSNEKIIYYLAQDLAYTEQNLADGEFLEVIKQPLTQIFAQAFAGKISDSKTLAGLMLLYGHLHPAT